MIFDVNHFVITAPGLEDLDIRDDFPVNFAGDNMPKDIKPNTILEDDNSTASRALVNGEWMKLVTVSGAVKQTRGGLLTSASSGGGSVGALSAGADGEQRFALFAERGRIDIQVMKNRVPLIFGGEYEFDTKLIDTVSGNVTWSSQAIGTRLIACAGGFTGDTFQKYSVLCPQPAAGKSMVLGVITKVYDSATGYVRVHTRAGGLGLYF